MDDLVGRTVYNGLGEPLGTVLEVARDHKGRLRIRVREPGPLGPIRVVGVEHVAGVDAAGVHLKGPRQGYHIAPLTRAPPDARVVPPSFERPEAPLATFPDPW